MNRGQQDWPKVTAIVTDRTKWQKLSYNDEDEWNDRPRYVTYYDIEFLYEVDGRIYQNIEQGVEGSQYGSYVPGKEFQIKYDPNDPQKCTTNLYYNYGSFIFPMGFYLFSISLGVYMCTSVQAFPNVKTNKGK